MIEARHASALIKYNGKDVTTDLAADLLDFSYTDAAPGEADDLSITLQDRLRRWSGPWTPNKGDTIVAEILPRNWDKPGDKLRLPCGSFSVDSLELSGPPDTVAIKAASIPGDVPGRTEKRTKAWEKATLKSIATEIAKRCKLKLLYTADTNPAYDRQDQTDQTDTAFLAQLAKDEGIALKVSGGQLVLFDEADFEKRKEVATLKRGESNILSYKFSDDTAFVAYSSATVSYTPPKPEKAKAADKARKDAKKTGGGTSPSPSPKTLTAHSAPAKGAKEAANKAATEKPAIVVKYTAPGAPKGGPVLKINQSVSSQAEAQRVARNALRENNKQAGQASFELMGNVRLVSGVTIIVKGFGRFDGKYIVVSATHSVGGSGYTTSITIRKVLGW
ncbi:hypothetical protein B9G55_01470 [Saccharibacillus sp. O16]|nr:hypothetical protein B9G55_01470 [Saccharibacillus sp. O16]